MENLLPYALILACPVSMGVMMWFMMRGHGDDREKAALERRVAELERGASSGPAASDMSSSSPRVAGPEPEAQRLQA